MTVDVQDAIAPLAAEWDALAERTGAPPSARSGWFSACFSRYETFRLPDGGTLHCPAGAARSAGRGDVAVLRLALEHVAWLAGRTASVSGLAARRRPQRYRPAAP